MPVRRWLCCALLILAFTGLEPARAAQAPTPPEAATEEQVRKIRAALKESSASPLLWHELLRAETILLNMQPQTLTGDPAADLAAARERERAVQQRVFSEWKAARPEDPAPYLMELQLTVPPERLEDGVVGLVERFPDDPGLLGRVLPILSRREQSPRAAALIEGALARHPERSELYPVALDFYQMAGNSTRQQELAGAWIERVPGDAGALRWWLNFDPGARDVEQARERIDRFVAAGGSGESRVEICGWLMTARNGAYRDSATRCLTQVSEQEQDAGLKMRAAGFLAAASGDEGDLARTLAAMPAESRLEAVLNAVRALGEGECARKVSLLQLLPRDGGGDRNRLFMKLNALRGCETYVPARDLYLEALAQARAEDLQGVIWAWFAKMNGVYPDDYGVGTKMVAILEERLKRQGHQRGVWEALAMAYELAGLDERRAAHLVAWLDSGLSTPNREQIAWLGAFYSWQDDPQAGIDALRRGWQKTHRLEIASALAELLLGAGRMDDFAALTAELAATPPAGAGKEPPEAGLARLLRARGTLVRQGPEAALPEYEAWAEHAEYLRPEEAEEYLAMVAGVRGEDAAANAARTLCSGKSMPTGSTPSDCAARLLAQLGESEGALRLLEAAAQRSPEDLRLQSSFAWAALQAGDLERAEAAYRRVLATDPKSEGAWMGLGQALEKKGDPAELEALVRQAERALGKKTDALVFALARAYRAASQAERAVEVLTALREGHPDPGWVNDELRQAYEALGREAPVSSESGSSPSAALPAPDDLRAQREAEAALLGLNGTIDEPKGREITKALAERGNVYANIRLSIWQQAGTQGFKADPRQAAATAAPHLPSLRAAAEGGEPFAQYLWGTVLLRGISVAKQPEAGGVWLRKAAEKGEPWALHNLGYMAQHGDGAEADLEAALRWYRRGAETGNPSSMLSLANLRLDEASLLREPAEGVQWLARAAGRGLPGAVSWYSALLFYGVPGVAADPVRSRPWLEKAAALEEPRGLFDLAASLLMGLGGPPDEVRAVKLLEQAGERGNAKAFWQLAWQATLGRGTLHDGKAAEAWIERAAALGSDLPYEILGAREMEGEAARRWFAAGIRALERLAASGDAHAGGLLARLYSGGHGVPEDDARAVALARPAAAAGSTEAMRVLGWAYDSGRGVEADLVQAAEWRRRGAEAGHSYSMMWYSQRLFDGDGVEKDPVAALAWLERSGERGNYWAVRDLGNLYDEGWHGIPRDERKAEHWKRKAVAAFNDTEARGWLLARGLIE